MYLLIQENQEIKWIPVERETDLYNPADQDKKEEIKAGKIKGRKRF